MRRLFWLTACVPLVCVMLVVSCSTSGESPKAMHSVQPIRPAKPVPPPPPKIYAYSKRNLNFLGMEELWTRGLYDKDAPTVRDAYVLGNYILVETNTLKLYGLSRKSGRPEFVVTLNDPMDVRACEDADNIYAVARNVLIAIDKRAFVAYRKYLKFAPASQMIADENNIYMGCHDGKVRAFRKDPRYFDWKQTTMGVVSSRPALGSKLIYAGSQDGKVYALSPVDGQRKWEFKTLNYISGDVVYADRIVYVASSDGTLYALHDLPQGSRTAQQAWSAPYATGSAIMSSPVVLGGIAYVINEDRECHAVDAATGKRKWVVKDVAKIISKGKLNTYLLRSDRYIMAVDNESGDIHWMLDVRSKGITRFLANRSDDAIYLVRANGLITVVRERRPEGTPKPEKEEIDKPKPAGGI